MSEPLRRRLLMISLFWILCTFSQKRVNCVTDGSPQSIRSWLLLQTFVLASHFLICYIYTCKWNYSDNSHLIINAANFQAANLFSPTGRSLHLTWCWNLNNVCIGHVVKMSTGNIVKYLPAATFSANISESRDKGWGGRLGWTSTNVVM